MKKMNYLFGILISLFGLSTLHAQTTETFTTNGTFTVPNNVTEITVECWGAGGGGVANNSNTAGAGGLASACTFNDVAFSGGNGVDGSGGNSGAGGGGAG